MLKTQQDIDFFKRSFDADKFQKMIDNVELIDY
jgi:hypothetical protein